MSAPVLTGPFIFAFIAAAIIGGFFFASKTGRVSRDAFEIVSVVTITMTIGMWLMWLCTWMHQWHPLIKPTWKEE